MRAKEVESKTKEERRGENDLFLRLEDDFEGERIVDENNSLACEN